MAETVKSAILGSFPRRYCLQTALSRICIVATTDMSVKYIWLNYIWVFYVKILREWRPITSIHNLRWTKYWPIVAMKSELYHRFMSARLDVLCSYFCLDRMVINLNTYISMFLLQLCAVFISKKKHLNGKIVAFHSGSGTKVVSRSARSVFPVLALCPMVVSVWSLVLLTSY